MTSFKGFGTFDIERKVWGLWTLPGGRRETASSRNWPGTLPQRKRLGRIINFERFDMKRDHDDIQQLLSIRARLIQRIERLSGEGIDPADLVELAELEAEIERLGG